MAEPAKADASASKSETATNTASSTNLQDWNTERYQQMAEIGVGAYGVVYKAKDLQNNDGFVAMKCLRVENTEQGMPLSMVREIALLRQLETKEHPNVVKLLDICLGRKTCHETQLMLVFEHIDQDLDMYLRSLPAEGLEVEAIRNITVQMLRGIDFLHSMRVIHRDLKPQNILITQTGNIKIADFGLARIFSVDMALTAVVVTLWYRAPEVLLQDSYATPVDLWSVGCIFAELYNRRPLFRGSGDVNQLRKIFNFLGRPSEADWPSDVAIPITSFPVQPAKPVGHFVPRMDAQAADLFQADRNNTTDHLLADENSAENPLDSTPSHTHRRLPYTRNMGATNDENAPFPLKPTPQSCWRDADSSVTHPRSAASIPEHCAPASAQIHSKAENSDTGDISRPTTLQHSSRGRAFGNLLPLNVKDGASGSLLPADPYQESAFLTPPSDLASTPSDTESSFSRSSSESNISQNADINAFLSQESSGLILEASVARPESATPSMDHGVVRRARAESEGQSRMSWTCDPVDGSAMGSPSIPIQTSVRVPDDGGCVDVSNHHLNVTSSKSTVPPAADDQVEK